LRALIFASCIVACGTPPTPDAGSSQYGDPCPCTGGLSCVEDDRFVGGYCTQVCSDGVCPGAADCDQTTSPPLCLARCGAASDCRDGYQCWLGNCRPACGSSSDCGDGARCSDGVCSAGCADDADCSPPTECVLGVCVEVPDDGGTMRTPGTPCAIDGECASGICLPADLGGVCTIGCAESSDCVEVPFDAACAPIAGQTICALVPDDGSRIAEACSIDADCQGRACIAGQCTEPCADATDCVTGQICTTVTLAGSSFMGCGYTPPAPGISIEEIDLGEIELGAGAATAFERAYPSDAVSITLQTRAVSGDPLELAFLTVTSPNGTDIFDVDRILMLEDPLERWLPVDTAESIAMLVPNTSPDRLAFIGGRYRWSVAPIPRMAGDSGRVRLRSSVLVKRSATGSVASGTIDLNVHLAGIGVTAANAPSNTGLQNSLARLDAILSAASIRIGSVSYFDVSDSRFFTIESTDGPASELASLFRTSSPRSGRALNVFLVRSIARMDDGSFQALGVAGGIPGPVGIHGTMHSGVVAAYEAAGSASIVGHILAHEIGHYLGLFHATESVRPCRFDETPATAMCAPFGGGDTLADTALDDTSNLMFWSISGGGGNTMLSPGQRLVMRLSALVGP
jgi:hypothetical protein